MGSSNSRRRSMSNSVEAAENPHAEGRRESRSPLENNSEESDLPAILAYLIRSGQVRILPSNESEGEEFYSDDEDSEFCEPARPPQVDPNPDTSNIKKNDIYEQIMLKSGRSSIADTSMPTVTHMLYKRQVGMNGCKQFNPGHRRVIITPFLPNYKQTVESFRQKAFCGTFSKEGDIFLSASQDQCVRIYDTKQGRFKKIKTIVAKDVGWSILDTAFSPDGNYMVYSSWSECIHLCNVYGDNEVHQALHLFPRQASFCIFSLTFSSDNREILGGANDGCLYVFDRDSNQRILKIDAHDDDVNAVAFADDTSQILFSGGDDGLCRVWDRRTLSEENPIPVGTMAGHYDGITYIDPKGDARYLLSNSKDQRMKLWDMRVMSSASGIQATKRAVSKQRWDYRWQQVPRKMNSRPRLEGDTSVMTYKGHSVLHTLIRCHFSPEFSTGQRYVYTGCATGSLVIYDTLTGKVVQRLKGHRSCVRDVSWHPFENTIMTTSWDGGIGKWEYRDMEEFQEYLSSTDSEEEEEVEEESRERRSRRLKKKYGKRCFKQEMMGCNQLPKRRLFD